MTLEEYAASEVVCETAAPPDVGEFIDALRADGYRVVKLENATQFVGNYHFVTEELT